ncbi:TIGR01777 family protein [Chryseotalea sanaruensis]|uniref:TIGR01777 family protein n=1 Tax=Chryseotalea sanaruensis TaxID=2482724 RepID=A0A401U7J2_9BACT|nr:TIGR01777 family oxidoreductase [Chryseotalea sanaruensis]GCC50859.1 TIGR01777 family protein [Chryseotalea sanaruensis]
MTKKNILITGASGLIGKRLTEFLLQKGHNVSHLGRSAKKGEIPSFVWNVEQMQMDVSALKGIDTVIHLAGAGIADKRWSEKRKQEILESRTQSTALLEATLKNTNNEVKHFISASAIGYYGFDLKGELYDEQSAPGTDYLASVTRQWEESIDKLIELPLRVAKLRIGIVLSDKGGALEPMVVPVKLFVGSPLASGKQMLSWIHIDDLCNMFIHLVENESLQGAYNGTGPYAVSNEDFTKAIARQLKRPLFLPKVPAFFLKLVLGEMANLIIYGSDVSSKKIQASGYQFQFNTLEESLQNLLDKK